MILFSSVIKTSKTGNDFQMRCGCREVVTKRDRSVVAYFTFNNYLTCSQRIRNVSITKKKSVYDYKKYIGNL